MMARRKTLSAAALTVLVAGGAAAWAFTPARVRADAPATPVARPAPVDPWTKGQVDRGNMVQGVLDYRSADPKR